MTDTYRVCVDCAHYVANGTLPEMGHGVDPATVRDADPEGVWAILSDPEPGFSWSACHRCESTLGGDRFHAERWEADGVPDTARAMAVLYNEHTGEILTLSAMTRPGAMLAVIRYSRRAWPFRFRYWLPLLRTLRSGSVGSVVTVPRLGAFPLG